MEDENEDGTGVIEEDYYAFLNIPRDVSWGIILILNLKSKVRNWLRILTPQGLVFIGHLMGILTYLLQMVLFERINRT